MSIVSDAGNKVFNENSRTLAPEAVGSQVLLMSTISVSVNARYKRRCSAHVMTNLGRHRTSVQFPAAQKQSELLWSQYELVR